MAIDAIGITPSSGLTPVSVSSSISQASFLQILLTQLQFQDPLQPVDNAQFIAQLAQFTTLAINQQESAQLDSVLTIQAAQQAIGLIGKSVQITAPGSTGANSVGTVSAISFSTGVPLLSIAINGTSVTNVQPSQVTLVQ
jgi:flagellar basal-body rod modification protein FlgD